jgi:glyoxylase-like metal-dependent hydrolase (beta-lactamase superfamily II)
VLAIPAHTAGSIAIHLPETGVIPGAFNIDRTAMLDSFRMLADLDPDVVCVGHGAAVVGDAGPAMRAALND